MAGPRINCYSKKMTGLKAELDFSFKLPKKIKTRAELALNYWHQRKR